MSLKEKLQTNVSWQVFSLAIGIIMVVFGYLIKLNAQAQAEIKGTNSDIVEIKVDVSEIKSDVKWIKATLDK